MERERKRGRRAELVEWGDEGKRETSEKWARGLPPAQSRVVKVLSLSSARSRRLSGEERA